MSKELIWLDDEPGTYTHKEAMKLENQEKRVPTIGELRIAWEQGIKFEDKWYWSSSVHPYYSNNAYVFDGRDGDVDNDYRGVSDVSVRCLKEIEK